MAGEDLGPLIRGEGHQPVPLSVLFGNPRRTQARVSPDGRWISYLAPSREGKGGVLNVWVVERHRGVDGGEARMVTHDKKRGIREHFWSENSRDIVYLQDGGFCWGFGALVCGCAGRVGFGGGSIDRSMTIPYNHTHNQTQPTATRTGTSSRWT